MNKKLLIFTFLILSLSHIASAETNLGYWVGIFPHYRINETQSLSLQAEYREIKNNSTGLFRPSYHFKFSNYFTLGLGYDLFLQKTREQRLWPEISGHASLKKSDIIFDWRIRHEYRFKQAVSKTGERTRIMVGAHFDLPTSEHYSLYLFNEIFFINHDFSKRTSRLDRNWLGARIRKGFKGYYIDYALFWESPYKSSQNNYYGLLSVGWNM